MKFYAMQTLRIIKYFVLILASFHTNAQSDTMFRLMNQDKYESLMKSSSCIKYDKIDTIKSFENNMLILAKRGIINKDTFTLLTAVLKKSNSNNSVTCIERNFISENYLGSMNGRIISPPSYNSGEMHIYDVLLKRTQFKFEIVKGMLNGVFTEYYPNGQIFTSGKYYKNARKGEWKFYYGNGKVAYKGKYKPKVIIFNHDNTKKNVIVFNRNNKIAGIISIDSFYNYIFTFYKTEEAPIIPNNIFYKKGIWNFYNDQGVLIRREKYKHGKRNGKWLYFDDSGKLYKVVMYKDNFIVETE